MRASCEKTADFKCRIALTVFAALSIWSAGRATADEEREDAEKRLRTLYEITPFVGYRLGGDFDMANSTQSADLDDHGSYAFSVAVRRDESSQYELTYARQETQVERTSPLAPLDVNVEYLHLGGTLDAQVESDFPLRPYLLGGLGITRLTLSSGTDDTRFSFSLGGGLRVPVTPRFNIRLEARGFLTLIDSNSAIFCASGSFGGVCSIRAKGSTFTQFELMAGAAFAF
jgi:opacity protein-like surface antigen